MRRHKNMIINPWRIGLILEYLFTEGSGETLNDTSGSGNHGTFKGAGEPSWDDSAVQFDLSDDYIDLTSAVNINDQGATILVDVYATGDYSGNYSGVYHHSLGAVLSDNDIDNDLIGIIGDGSGNYKPFGRCNAFPWQDTDAGANTVIKDDWNTIIFTVTGYLGQCYVNGVSITGDRVIASDGVFSRIGNLVEGADVCPFGGKIRRIMIWNRCLSANEIALLSR